MSTHPARPTVEFYDQGGKFLAVRAGDKDAHQSHDLCALCAAVGTCSIRSRVKIIEARAGVILPVWACPEFQGKNEQ